MEWNTTPAIEYYTFDPNFINNEVIFAESLEILKCDIKKVIL